MTTEKEQPSAVHLLFDGPPGPECGRFVEAEDPTGKSVNAGEWSQRPDGYWQLVIQQPSADVVDERAAFERHFKSVGSLTVNQLAHARDTDGMPFYEHLPTRIAWSAWQARARLDQPTASAGVVVGALVSALEGIVHDERVPNEVSQDYAALLIEARRLNHCRAQDVPDGWNDGLPPAGELCEARIPHHTASGLQMLWCEVEPLHHAIIQGAIYSWVKEPGADGGFYAPMMLSFRRLAAAPSAQQKESGDE